MSSVAEKENCRLLSLLCPLLTQLPLFPPRARHTCHLENSPLGYRIRAQMLRDFLLFATEAASVTMESRHSQKRTKKKESIVNDEFIFTLCHMAMIDDASHRCYST